MEKIKHNKKANTGLIFEMLSQQVVVSSVEKDAIKIKKALYLIKKYFNKDTELFEELQLINSIMYNEVEKWQTASRLLSEVIEASKKLDLKKLKNEKFHLLNEINSNFNKETFFRAYVPNYTIYASLYSLMEAARDSKPRVDLANKVKIEENILNHLIDNREIKRINEFSKTDPNAEEVDDLAFHFIIKKFNQRYNKVLNEGQKEILQQYISCTSKKKFDYYVDKKVKSIESGLYEGMKTADKSMISKLWEAMQKLGKINEYSKDKKTELLMTYSQLLEELKTK